MHPRLGPCVPVHIMDSKSSIKSSHNSLDPDRSDRPPGEPVPSTAAPPDDTIGPGPASQPQNRMFTFFKRLPAELRLLIWELACAHPGPRIHFAEAISVSNKTKKYFRISSEGRVPEIRWEIEEGKRDPCFQWSGRDLLPSAPRREEPS